LPAKGGLAGDGRAPDLIVHFGWDLRLIVGVSRGIDDLLDEVRRDGLFVYKGS